MKWNLVIALTAVVLGLEICQAHAAPPARITIVWAGRGGVGRAIVADCARGARAAGCEILHVDFDEDLVPFYIDACGFTPTHAGLLDLTSLDG